MPPPARKRYIWGSLFTRFAIWIALIIISFIPGIIFEKLSDVQKTIHFSGLEPSPQQIAGLRNLQNDFCKKYDNTFNLLSSSYDGKFFFKSQIDKQFTTPPPAFNEFLRKPEDIRESLAALTEYQKNILGLKLIFENYFSEQMDRLYRRMKMNSTDSNRFGQRSTKGITSAIAPKTFYLPQNEADIRQTLDKNFSTLNTLKKDKDLKRLLNTVNDYEIFFQFVRMNLLGRKNATFGGVHSNLQNLSGRTERLTKEEQAQFELFYILSKSEEVLTAGWEVEGLSKQLEKALSESYQTYVKNNETRYLLWKTFFIQSALIGIALLLFAFFLMVFADYLKAHFDVAKTVAEEKF